MINIIEKDGATIITIENPTSNEKKLISEAKRVKDAPAIPAVKKASGWSRPDTANAKSEGDKKGWGNSKPTQPATEKPKSTSWKNANATATTANSNSEKKSAGFGWGKNKKAEQTEQPVETQPSVSGAETIDEGFGDLNSDDWVTILDDADLPF